MIERKTVIVTPDLALEWLDGNTHNRKLYQPVVERLAREMREGRWRLTHQGIAFNKAGVLIDGQHRLWAVVEAKRPIEFEVTRGLEDSAQEVVDIGLRRREVDILQLRGEKVDHVKVGVAKLLAVQLHGRIITQGDVVATFTRYAEAIHWVANAIKPVRGIRLAPVMTAIVRAYISGAASPTELIRFCQVLSDGMMTAPTDQPIILLRNALLAGRADRADQWYGKTERALAAYLKHETIKNLYVAPTELFPLRGETAPNTTKKKPAGKGRVQAR